MKRIAHLVVGLGIVGLQLNRLAQFFDCFAVTVLIVITPGQVVFGSGVAGPELKTTFVSLGRVGVLLGVVVIDVAEAEMRQAHVRLQSNCFLIFFNGFRVTTEVTQRIAELRVRFRITRTATDCRVQCLDCVVIVFLLVVDPANLVIGPRVIRLDANSLIEGG